MNDQTDSQLLRAYAEGHSDPAFAELVRRHIDLVHSAALRMVCDAHLAQDVTQAVFIALAKNAAQLTNRPILSGWLHRTAQNIAAQTVRTDVRRRAREQEAAAMNELLSATPDVSWDQIAPHLDVALGELDESERDALLFRYFERKSAREMASQLGISDDAAQKRVSRAVERLRELFAKRGTTIGTSGLVVCISANAVQAAPVGLAITISTAAALTGTTLATTATVTAATTAVKAIAMTTLQKTLVTATIAALAGVGIYEARQVSQLRDQVQTLQQQQSPLTRQIAELNQAFIDATNQLTALRDDNERLNRNTAELLRLRREASLRREQASQESLRAKGFKTDRELIESIDYDGGDDQVKAWKVRGAAGIRMLVSALQSADYARPTRMCVARLLGQLGSDAKSAIPDVINMIKTEKDDGVRAILIGSFEGRMNELSESQCAEMFPDLVRAFESRDSGVRNNALVLLQTYAGQSETVIPLMVKALQDRTPGVRVMAVKALQKIDPQNSAGVKPVEILVGCLTGPVGDMPAAANDAILMLGELRREPEVVVPVLIQTLQSRDSYIRQNSAAALKKFGAQAQPALDALTKALEDPDKGVRNQAWSAIASIKAAASTK